MDSINTALSGLNAAATRIGVSANNIANAQSTGTFQETESINKPYIPKQVVQTTQDQGGVKATLQDVSPPSIPVFAPDNPAAGENGVVNIPNVDLVEQVSNQLLAVDAYKSNLNVIKRTDEMTQSLLDIQS